MIAYEKQCLNYTFTAHDHDITATLVQVPELGDDTFIEIETLIEANEHTHQATQAIHNVLADIGLNEQHLAPDFYIDMVRNHRSR